MYNYLLINKGVQNQTYIQQEFIDIANIDEIQVLDINATNIVDQVTALNDITTGVTQINNHFTHQVRL